MLRTAEKQVEWSFFITVFCCIFSNVNGIEKPAICCQKLHLLHLLKYKFEYNDETIKIWDG